jgi:hypothetical protein
MLRIEANHLCQKGELFYYQDELFTGIAFFLTDPEIHKINEYRDGLLIGPYMSKWLDNSPEILRIDLNELDGDGEHQQAFFNEQPFTGIGYDIDEGVCHQESEYKNGWEGKTICFYADGAIGSIYLENEALSEEVIYDRQGFIKEYRFHKFNVCSVKYAYTDQLLQSLWIDGDFFNKVNKNEYLLDIDVLDSLEKLINQKIASTLFMNGTGVNDDVINMLIENDELKCIEDISISGTSVNLGPLVDIITNTSLKSLWIQDTRDEILTNLPPILEEYKRNTPNCDITFNDTEF